MSARRAAKGKRRRARVVERPPRPMLPLLAPQTPLYRWKVQQAKLEAWYGRVEAAHALEGEIWKEGQLRYIRMLLENHLAMKPAE